MATHGECGETRTDPESEALLDADLTVMPADQFDAFVEELEPADAAPRLTAAAAGERSYRHR